MESHLQKIRACPDAIKTLDSIMLGGGKVKKDEIEIRTEIQKMIKIHRDRWAKRYTEAVDLLNMGEAKVCTRIVEAFQDCLVDVGYGEIDSPHPRPVE